MTGVGFTAFFVAVGLIITGAISRENGFLLAGGLVAAAVIVFMLTVELRRGVTHAEIPVVVASEAPASAGQEPGRVDG